MERLQSLSAEITCGDERRAEIAVRQLAALGAEALPLLIQLLASPDADTRWWATWALAEIRLPQVPPLLVTALQDREISVRQAAALALRQQPSPQAIPYLIDLLNVAGQEPNDPTLAHLAAAALIAVGEPAVLPLIQVLENGPQPARIHAARALAMIGDKRAIPALFACLDSGSAILEYWAAEGLERMGVGMTFLKPE
jgi:hypothetical protein